MIAQFLPSYHRERYEEEIACLEFFSYKQYLLFLLIHFSLSQSLASVGSRRPLRHVKKHKALSFDPFVIFSLFFSQTSLDTTK